MFLINVPLGLLGIMLAQILIAPTPTQARALSLVSHAFGVIILSALSFFLIEGPGLGWLSAPVLAAAALAVVTVLALLQRDRSGAHPLLPAALFETSGFAAANMTGFLINFAVFGQFFFAEAARNTKRLAQMKALDVPFQLIWGETDPYLNTGVARDFQAHLKRPSLHLLAAGHWVQIDAPEQVATIMLADA